MLVVLLGPSGVGKSAAIEQLLNNYNWIPLISLVTRPPREGDSFKVSISDDSYNMLRDLEKLWSDVEQGGYRYALLRSEIELAVHSTSIFIVDFSLEAWKKYFADLKHVSIYVAAETQDSLLLRLQNAKRAARSESSLRSAEELEEWFLKEGAALGTVRLVNHTGQLENLVNSIAAVVLKEI